MSAQTPEIDQLLVSTIDRAPFSFEEQGERTGFSIDLRDEIAERLDLSYTFQKETIFADMLTHVASGEVDLAIANISITSEREQRMDFSFPIYDS